MRNDCQRMSLAAPGADLEIWWADVSRPFTDETLMACLAPDEIARVSHYRRDVDRRRSLVAHALLHQALAVRAGAAAPPCVVQRCARCGAAHGRPVVVDDEGRPRGDLHVSLTHAGGMAAVAVSSRPVGIDLEPVTADVAAGIRVAFSSGELRGLEGVPPDERAAALLAGWTRKEALFKAGCGEGDFDRLDLSSLEPRPQMRRGPQVWRDWLVWDIAPAADYRGAVALALPGALQISGAPR
jgi:4'-phosphopantetheinyl transferase